MKRSERVASVVLAGLLMADAAIVALLGPGEIETGLLLGMFALCAGLGLWILLRRGVLAYLSTALFGVAATGLLALFVIGGHYASEMSSPGRTQIPEWFGPVLTLQVCIAILAIILLILSPGIGRAAVD